MSIAGLTAVGITVTAMRLEMMTPEDVDLRLRTETDPVMMGELGGPRPPDDIERAHAKSLALAVEGRCWPLKVIPDGSSSAVGEVTVFESSHEGETIYEIGWMVLPEFQNRGSPARPCRRCWRRRGRSGSSGESTPSPQ
jgi:RimJ/RimL family protein N-acetyltransferase